MTDERYRQHSLRDLLSWIETSCGSFAIGFKYAPRARTARKAGKAEERRDGDDEEAGEEEEVASNAELTSKLAGMRKRSHVSLVSMLSRLLPSGLLNATVNHVTKSFRYVHCEIVFFLTAAGKARFDRNGNEHVIAVAVQQRAPVHIYARTFGQRNYKWLSVAASSDELRAIVCHFAHLQGQSFENDAMARCLTAPGHDEQRSRWYCSMLCASALEFLPQPAVHFNRINTLTVDDLAALVERAEYRPKGDRLVPTRMDEVFQSVISEKNNAFSTRRR